MKFSLIKEDTFEVLTIQFEDPVAVFTVTSANGNYNTVKNLVLSDADEQMIKNTLSPSLVIEEKFKYLTNRISVRNGRIYLDGDEIHNALTEQVVRFLEQGVEDWRPLVYFYENAPFIQKNL